VKILIVNDIMKKLYMKENNLPNSDHSFILPLASGFVEWGNKNLTLSHWFFRKSKNVFIKLEAMMIIVTVICIGLLFYIRYLPIWVGILISILLIQRVLEFLIVYSRNFIFNRGRIFLQFNDQQKSGEWLIIMFGLNIVQVLFVFSIWFQMISYINPMAFSQQLFPINSLYYSYVTFVTVGYGDIYAISPLAQGVAIGLMAFTFYTLVIAVNGLISVHFNKK